MNNTYPSFLAIISLTDFFYEYEYEYDIEGVVFMYGVGAGSQSIVQAKVRNHKLIYYYYS